MNHCLICGQTGNPMIRIYDDNGQLHIGTEPEPDMKTVSVCQNSACLMKVKKAHILEKVFQRKIPYSFYQSMLSNLTEPSDSRSGLLGLGVRSRKVVPGFTAVEIAARRNQLSLIILDEGAKPTLQKRIQGICGKYRIPLTTYRGDKSMDTVVGKINCKCAGVKDPGLANILSRQFADRGSEKRTS